jgi:hypothetical protein
VPLGVGLRRSVVVGYYSRHRAGEARRSAKRESSHQPSVSPASLFSGAASVTRLPRARISRMRRLGGGTLLLGSVSGLLLPHQSRHPAFLQRKVNALHQVFYLIEGRIP